MDLKLASVTVELLPVLLCCPWRLRAVVTFFHSLQALSYIIQERKEVDDSESIYAFTWLLTSGKSLVTKNRELT